MKRLCVLLIASFVVLCTAVPAYASETDETQSVVISEENFPDETFREIVRDSFDENSDGVLSPAEIQNITRIYIRYASIKSIQGIKNFTSLEMLIFDVRFYNYDGHNHSLEFTERLCNENITEIDVSGMKSLKELDCGFLPNLTSLNVKDCVALRELECSCSGLKEIDASGLAALWELRCDNDTSNDWPIERRKFFSEHQVTPLVKLNLKGCTGLYGLYCAGNELSELDLSDCRALNTLWCKNNRLTELDVRDCKKLTRLDCSGNKLTALDVSWLEELDELDCSKNRLSSLIVRGADLSGKVECRENNLEKVDLSDTRTYRSCCNFDKGVSVRYPDWYVKYIVIAGIVVVSGVVALLIWLKKKKRGIVTDSVESGNNFPDET